MKKQLISLTIMCALFGTFTATAADGLDDVTMEITKKEFKRGHKMHFPAKQIIEEYMLEKGDITQEQIDAMKAKKKADREELKALKDAGDTAGFEAKLAELKTERQERKAQLKEYIDNNEDLKTAIREKKEQMKEERKRRRDKKREKKEESGE